MLKLRLFGTGQAQYDGQSVTGFPSQQAWLLLCYLILNKPHPIHRERIATTFWGEYPNSEARKYLRNALWRLRQMMQAVGADSEDYLAIEEDRIAFVGSGPFWLDIEIFELEISSCLNISEQELSSDKVQALESAVDLYIGDLLEGVYQDWCLYDREHLRLLYVNTLHKIMAYHILGGNIPHGLDCGQRLLELDETQELVHRQMMRLYLRQGDRRSAIAQYKHCYQILQQELGISPTRETRDLYREILAGNSISASEMILNPTMTDKGSLIRQALGRLHSLQRSVEETRTELKGLEKIISQVLAEMRH